MNHIIFFCLSSRPPYCKISLEVIIQNLSVTSLFVSLPWQKLSCYASRQQQQGDPEALLNRTPCEQSRLALVLKGVTEQQ